MELKKENVTNLASVLMCMKVNVSNCFNYNIINICKTNRKEWNDVKSKQLLNAGVEHCKRKGNIIKAKKLGPPCTEKCRIKCIEKLNNDVHKTIFDLYWG